MLYIPAGGMPTPEQPKTQSSMPAAESITSAACTVLRHKPEV